MVFGQKTGYVKAVDGVSIDVYPGETLGLVGESGCGKTTIGRSIIRLEEAYSGEVIYKGENVLKMNAERLRSLEKRCKLSFKIHIHL